MPQSVPKTPRLSPLGWWGFGLHGAVAAKHAPAVTAAVKTIFAHTDPEEVADQWECVAATRRYLSDISMAELRKVIAAKHAATTPLAEQRQIA